MTNETLPMKSWLPDSPSLSDTALSYFLGERITPELPQQLAESASHLQSKFAIRYCDLSVNGQKKLLGMDDRSFRILLQRVLDYASTAKDGLVLVACIRLANAALTARHNLE